MAIETELYGYLTTAPAATQAVIGTRLYPVVLPQSPTYPAATYQVIAESTPMAHDGPGDLRSDTIQVDCFAVTYAAARALARAVESDLNGYRGAMGAERVDGIFWKNMIDHYDDQAEVWRVVVEFLVNWV